MSVELKCDRCAAAIEVTTPGDAIGAVIRNANLPNGWGTVQVAKFNQPAMTKHLCDSCRGDLVRFMTGTLVPRKSRPNDQVIVLQHEPVSDCKLVWDPEKNGGYGGLMCHHDDGPRYYFLVGKEALATAVMAEPEPMKFCPFCQDTRRPVHKCIRDVDQATFRRAGTLTAEITGEVFNPGTGRTLKRDDDPELFDALVEDLKALGHEKCGVCGIDVTKLWMVIHHRQAHPDPIEDGAEGPVERRDREDAEALAAVTQCRMCRHAKHGTRRCLVDEDNPNGKCPCVGALEDQLRGMPTQRSAPLIEESSDE